MAVKVALGNPRFKSFLNDSTLPNAAGKVYTYEPGTSTWKVAYQDKAGTAYTANPIVLDDDGEATIFWDGEYDIEIYDTNNNLIDVIDGFNAQDSTDRLVGGVNVVPNGSFEIGATGSPDLWTLAPLTGGTITWVTASSTSEDGDTFDASLTGQALDGRRAVRMVHPSGASNGGGTATSDYIPCNGDMNYFFTFTIYVSATGAKNKFDVMYYDASKSFISTSNLYTSTASPTSATTYWYLEFPPSNAKFMRVQLTGGATDTDPGAARTTYFDDVRVQQAQFSPASWASTSSVSFYKTDNVAGGSDIDLLGTIGDGSLQVYFGDTPSQRTMALLAQGSAGGVMSVGEWSNTGFPAAYTAGQWFGYEAVSDTLNALVLIDGATGAYLDMNDSGGAADDKKLRYVVDGGIGKFMSLNDALTTNVDNILVMDLGTGNVGMGTATPGNVSNLAGLDVYGTASSATAPAINVVTSTDDYPAIQIAGYAHDNCGIFFDAYYNTSSTAFSSDVGSNYAILKSGDIFYTLYDTGIVAGTTTGGMAIGTAMNSKGDIGQGVVPKTWASAYLGYQFGLTGSILSNTSIDYFALNGNAYFDGAWKYITAGTAVHAAIYDGVFEVYTAPSGAADGSVSWTERLGVENTGGVNIGPVAASSYHSNGDNLVVYDGVNAGITIATGTTTAACTLYFADGTGASAIRGYIQYDHNADAMYLGTAAATAININSSGEVGIGGSPVSGRKLAVTGSAIISTWLSGSDSNGYLRLYGDPSATNHITLDDRGNLKFRAAPSSAWSGTFSVLEMGDRCAIWGHPTSAGFYFTENVYYDGTWRYRHTDEATRIYSATGSGDIYLDCASSGTAGNAITFNKGIQVYSNAGVTIGSPTGGNKGTGTLNATAVYDDNTLLTCYVFDAALDGDISEDKWDNLVPDRKHIDKDPITDTILSEVDEPRIHEDMRKFKARLGGAEDPLDIDKYAEHWKTKRHLTSMPNEIGFDPKDNLDIGSWVQRLVETVEIQAVLIEQLNQRLKTLEAPQV